MGITKGVYCMKRMMYGIMGLFVIITSIFTPIGVAAASKDNVYYDGETQKKDDDGYDKDKNMKDSDVHYGWSLGQFQITGYTRKQEMEDGSPLFIKNVGDTISLSFLLEQDITALNGEDNVFISEDKDGYDNYFGISKDNKTNFGCGTLLVKYTDYQNKTTYVAPYVDYLNGVEEGAETDIQFFDEGDYEVALDYEIRKNNIDFWKVHTAPSYSHYQILIKFSVRNGNCMVYPFDVESHSELVNSSFTENGFYLDLARSRYLNIDVKKMNYVESDGTLIEDVRFNKPASDGEAFTDEGIYVITVKNVYTNRETEKKIYVGANPILKAYVTTGKDIEYIKEMIAEGAIIEDDGTITLPTNEVIEEETEELEIEEKPTDTIVENIKRQEIASNCDSRNVSVLIVIIVLIIVSLWIAFNTRKKKKSMSNDKKESAEAEAFDPAEKKAGDDE
jgi:hypothetical protein